MQVSLEKANVEYKNGVVIIESDELAKAIQDRTADVGAEEENNGFHLKGKVEIDID